MTRSLWLSVRAAGWMGFLVGSATLAAASPPEAKSEAAQQAVAEALNYEALGQNHERARLLHEAAELSDIAEVQWARGYVQYKDRWLRPDEIVEQSRTDTLLEEYRARRKLADDTADSQWELANWCREQKLPEQQRAHLERVLQLEPNHPQARQAAGYQKIDRSWIHISELAEHREAMRKQREAFEKWRPQLDDLARRLRSKSATSRAQAEHELAAIVDPDCIPALEAVFCTKYEPLAVKGIERLERIDHLRSTLALARQAIYSPWPSVREQAATALRSCPRDQYVPQWLAALGTRIEASVTITPLSERLAVERKQFTTETQFAYQQLTWDGWRTVGTTRTGVRPRPIVGVIQFDTPKADLYTFRRLATINLQREELNDRLLQALTVATEASPGDSPQAWWEWWQTENELHAGEKGYEWQYCQGYAGGTAYVRSCFPAGTPVWTIEGRKAIDKIVPGDLVLARDVESGELAYKAVLQTTVRPPAKMVCIEAGDDIKLTATGGHRMWVSGEGWVRARQLKSGQPLHTLDGAVLVSHVRECADAEAYNLVVADFHTYFVGDAKILCQDHIMPRPTNVVVPGLAAP